MEPVPFTVEGRPLYGEYHPPPKPRKAIGAVLCLHGLNSSLKEFGVFPARLADRGFHVFAFDQRGFGASGGERGRIGMDRLMQDVDGAIDALRERAGNKVPLLAVGHSLGGAYALGVQARQHRFDALAIAHVVDRIFDELGSVERSAFHAIGRMHRRRMRKGKGASYLPYRVSYKTIFEDKAASQAAAADGFLLSKVNIANYDFASTMQARTWAAKVTVPALCIQSQKDRVVKPEHSWRVYESLAGPVRVVEHQGGHSCFRDLDADKVLDAVADWFTEQCAREGRVKVIA